MEESLIKPIQFFSKLTILTQCNTYQVQHLLSFFSVKRNEFVQQSELNL